MPVKFTNKQMMAHVEKDNTFAEWYVEEFMKKNLPDLYYSISSEGKREMTVNGRAYAREYGFNDSESQAHFITLMWNIGANFFMHDGFREIANNKTLTGAEKIDAFYAVPKDQAVQAIMNPDDHYWYPEMVDRRMGGLQ